MCPQTTNLSKQAAWQAAWQVTKIGTAVVCFCAQCLLFGLGVQGDQKVIVGDMLRGRFEFNGACCLLLRTADVTSLGSGLGKIKIHGG